MSSIDNLIPPSTPDTKLKGLFPVNEHLLVCVCVPHLVKHHTQSALLHAELQFDLVKHESSFQETLSLQILLQECALLVLLDAQEVGLWQQSAPNLFVTNVNKRVKNTLAKAWVETKKPSFLSISREKLSGFFLRPWLGGTNKWRIEQCWTASFLSSREVYNCPALWVTADKSFLAETSSAVVDVSATASRSAAVPAASWPSKATSLLNSASVCWRHIIKLVKQFCFCQYFALSSFLCGKWLPRIHCCTANNLRNARYNVVHRENTSLQRDNCI